MTSLTFYGGINEIGGNKILLEDKGTRIFLDFGMQMGKVNDYFVEFMQPRKFSGFGDLMEFGLLPNIQGIYRRDHAKHIGYGDHKQETSIDGVLLSHAHIDHCAYIHYLRADIPVYCSEATKLIMQGLEDTSASSSEYLQQTEAFTTYENKKGGISRANSRTANIYPRDIRIVPPQQKFKIDSIQVEPILIDHSLPGVYGFIIYTSDNTIGYTADIRFHGRRPEDSQRFVDRCASEDIDCMLCEGTRIDNDAKSDTHTQDTQDDGWDKIHRDNSKMGETIVEQSVTKSISTADGLVACSYPPRDLDRLLSFYNAAKSAGRDLVIDIKQAHILNLFAKSEQNNNTYPSPTDPHIKIFIPRKSWGLLGRDPSEWSAELVEQDYVKFERSFLDWPNHVNYSDIKNRQKDYVFFCSDFQLQNLMDIRPDQGARYIRSATEPFNEEMNIDHERVKRWLHHFGLLEANKDWKTVHVSGHGTRDQIKHVIDDTTPKKIVPIHTEHPDEFYKLHKNVQKVTLGEQIHLVVR